MRWAAGFCAALEAGLTLTEAKAVAVQAQLPKKYALTKSAKRRAEHAWLQYETMLALPDVRKAVAEFMAIHTGISPARAFELLGQHMLGTAPENASMAALQMYLKYAIPEPPKQTINRNFNASFSLDVMKRGDDDVPSTATRLVGSAMPEPDGTTFDMVDEEEESE